jgi:hypothetical protein
MTVQTLKQNYIQSLLASCTKACKAFIDAIQFLLLKIYGENEFILCNVDLEINAQSEKVKNSVILCSIDSRIVIA